MNERVPDSSGLPLRAMVMVLLFLGIVFLLIAFQAMRSGDNSGDDGTAMPTVTSTSPTTTSVSEEPAPKADVRVFNVSEVLGAADRTANLLRENGWNVTETGNLPAPPNLTVTTVFFGPTEGEQQSAEELGKVLDGAPVLARIPEVAEQPPGVIVLVTG
jgi:hypothetical protein